MTQNDINSEVNTRYSELSGSTCCLSCGGAITYADVKEGEHCVDLGSGRGNDVIRLADQVGMTGFATGVDLSDGMIAKATKTAKKLGVSNVSFIQSELTSLPLDSDSIDLVISNCTLNHVLDQATLWSDIFRIVKPGGRVVISDIFAMQAVSGEFRNDPKAVAECWAGAVTKPDYLSTLGSTGFEDITIIEESAPYEKGQINVSSFTFKAIKPIKGGGELNGIS